MGEMTFRRLKQAANAPDASARRHMAAVAHLSIDPDATLRTAMDSVAEFLKTTIEPNPDTARKVEIAALRKAAACEDLVRYLGQKPRSRIDIETLNQFFLSIRDASPALSLDLFRWLRRCDEILRSESRSGPLFPAIEQPLNEATFTPFRRIERHPPELNNDPFLPDRALEGDPDGWARVPEGIASDIWTLVGPDGIEENDVILIEILGPVSHEQADGADRSLAPATVTRSHVKLPFRAVVSRHLFCVTAIIEDSIRLESMAMVPGGAFGKTHEITADVLETLAARGDHLILRAVGRRGPPTLDPTLARTRRVDAILKNPQLRRLGEMIIQATRRGSFDKHIETYSTPEGTRRTTMPEWLARHIERCRPGAVFEWTTQALPLAGRQAHNRPRTSARGQGAAWEIWTDLGADAPLPGDILKISQQVPLSWPVYQKNDRPFPSGVTAPTNCFRTLIVRVYDLRDRDDSLHALCDVIWSDCQNQALALPRYAEFDFDPLILPRLTQVMRLRQSGPIPRTKKAETEAGIAALTALGATRKALADAIDPDSGKPLGVKNAEAVLAGRSPVRLWMLDWFRPWEADSRISRNSALSPANRLS